MSNFLSLAQKICPALLWRTAGFIKATVRRRNRSEVDFFAPLAEMDTGEDANIIEISRGEEKRAATRLLLVFRCVRNEKISSTPVRRGDASPFYCIFAQS